MNIDGANSTSVQFARIGWIPAERQGAWGLRTKKAGEDTGLFFPEMPDRQKSARLHERVIRAIRKPERPERVR